MGWPFATGDERDAEILALRHQLLVVQRQVPRPRFTETDRTILSVLATVFDRSRFGQVLLIAKPDTVLGWHRRLVARHRTQPPRRGRPLVHAEIRRLAVRLGTENLTWGYRRIQGGLSRLGYKVARSNIWKILRAAGIDPTPNRCGPTWGEFIRSQANALIVTDFCCVDTVTLRRLHVLFFVEVGSRRVHLGGITPTPPGRGPPRPPRAPMANAFAERWVRTLRHELLDRTLIWNQRQLRSLLGDYLAHDNCHRPHRSLDERAPNDTGNVTAVETGRTIERHTTSAGVINEYPAAA